MATFHAAHPASTALRLERIGAAIIRYRLALIIVWIGALKFADYEAAAIEGLVANSPLLSWMYGIASVPWSRPPSVSSRSSSGFRWPSVLRPRVSAVGSSGDPHVLHTLSFMVSTPGCGSRDTASHSCRGPDSSWSRT